MSERSTNGDERNGKPSTPRIKPYHAQAGGWGALQASWEHTRKNRGVLKAVRSMLRVNQPDGFDCPGCAWPEPDDPGAMEFCENGVKAVTFETTEKRVTPEFFQRHRVSDLKSWSDRDLENSGRLTHPMRYNTETDRYEPIDWERAFELIGDKLRSLSTPDESIFYTSGRTSNEAAFLYQLFARLLGTNNMPDCSNMCHESSGVALGEAIGIGKGTVRLKDFEHADAIFVIGQNPGTNHPRMLTALQKARRRGAEIVTMNPLKERGLERFTHPQHKLDMVLNRQTPISSLYLQVAVGGDLAALKGLMKLVLEAEAEAPGQVLDHAFIERHTDGFEALREDLERTSWERIQTQSALSRDQLQLASDIYVKSRSTIICWAMGLTQQRHAVATIQQIVNLLLLRGNLGRPGAGACPVRGHSNVQGDRTVGITERPGRSFLDRLGEAFGFAAPREHGVDVVGAIERMEAGTGRVFIGMGGNFASATPDTAAVARALARCDLTVQISTKLNRSHLEHGREALILPCLGRTEIDRQATGPQRVTVEDSMSQVHASQGRNEPASEQLKSECAIVAGMAKAAVPDRGEVDWDALVADYSRIRDKIAQTLPDLFQDYNRRIETPGGFYLGNSAAAHDWRTKTGKARFIGHPIPELTLPAGRLKLMTLRSHDQYNTTIYDHNDRYRGVYGTRRILLINPEDLREQGLTDRDWIDITSHSEDDDEPRIVQGFQAVAYEIPRGCVAGYFPELNPLVSRKSFADKSRTPLSKFVPVSLAPSRAADQAMRASDGADPQPQPAVGA